MNLYEETSRMALPIPSLEISYAKSSRMIGTRSNLVKSSRFFRWIKKSKAESHECWLKLSETKKRKKRGKLEKTKVEKKRKEKKTEGRKATEWSDTWQPRSSIPDRGYKSLRLSNKTFLLLSNRGGTSMLALFFFFTPNWMLPLGQLFSFFFKSSLIPIGRYKNVQILQHFFF